MFSHLPETPAFLTTTTTTTVALLLLLTATEFLPGGRSPYCSTDETNKNKIYIKCNNTET